MGRSFQLWINNKWKSHCKVEWKRDYEKHSCSRWLYSRSRHVVAHTVNGDARGRVGGIQMFAQERAVVDLQTLPLQVQLLSDHQHITIIQVMHQLQHTRPAGYTNTHAHTPLHRHKYAVANIWPPAVSTNNHWLCMNLISMIYCFTTPGSGFDKRSRTLLLNFKWKRTLIKNNWLKVSVITSRRHL